MESNRRTNALTSTLRRHDIAAQAERRRRNLVKTPEFEGCRCCYDPNGDGGEYRALLEFKAQQQQVEEEEEDESNHQSTRQNNSRQVSKDGDEYSSDDEFDYLLDADLSAELHSIRELEEKRRAELEYDFFMRQVAAQHGYGVHRQLHPARVLKASGLGATSNGRIPPPAVILHLFDPDSMASASLDYFLETTLASANPGTVFLRSGGRSTLLMDPSVAQKHLPSHLLDPDHDMPALLAIRDGVVVNACPRLQGLTTHSSTSSRRRIDEHAVRQWLKNSGVLLNQAPRLDFLCAIRPEEDALMNYLDSHEQHPTPLDERYNCGVDGCNKTFKHEHVGIRTSEQDGLVVKEDIITGNEQ